MPPLDDSYFLQQSQHQRPQVQQQQQAAGQQRDLQLRQALLREQVEQQLQEQQLRAIGEQLNDFPDLQQHYQSLLLNEQLQRQRSGGLSGPSALGGMASVPGTNNQNLPNVSLLRDQAALRVQREQANLRAYEELLLRQQQQQRLQQQQQLASSSFQEERTTPQAQGPTPASILMSALSAQQQQSQQQQNQQQQAQQVQPSQLQEKAQSYSSAHEFLSRNMATGSGGVILPRQSPAATSALPVSSAATVVPLPPAQASLNRMHSLSQEESEHSAMASEKRPANGIAEAPPKRKKRKYTKRNGSKKATKKKGGASSSPVEQAEIVYQPASSPLSPSSSMHDDYDDDRMDYSEHSALEAVAVAADMVAPHTSTKGTVEELLQADEDLVQLEGAAMVLTTKLSEVEPWPEDEDKGLELPSKAAETVSTRSFQSFLPSLPEEPIDDDYGYDTVSPADLYTAGTKATKDVRMTENGVYPESKESSSAKKALAVLEYPYPVDTWWPSNSGVRKERKAHGEISDEDDFVEVKSTGKPTLFRANDIKIRSRLSRAKEPGVLEKLPHCRIHRLRISKNSSAPELVYCHQVTEIYPHEIMCCCSKCGTWRHAACGGHYKPYSTRENAHTPFVAVCDRCHEEDKYMIEYPQGHHRIERQRLENIRRGLATSSVLRHSSYSKHGGTYKWPLGSVSATHIGGHTRSVHVRHDKAEKQWTDMAARLGRGYGYRQKERVRSRTKEFERLLVSIEDAEAFTDRHNMLLFLQRDTGKTIPAGFENQVGNIFDPADDDFEENDDATGIPSNGKKGEDASNSGPSEETEENRTDPPPANGVCSRPGCDRRRRFDSIFCCDACGIATLELDLLRTLQDAQDIHPSVLRH